MECPAEVNAVLSLMKKLMVFASPKRVEFFSDVFFDHYCASFRFLLDYLCFRYHLDRSFQQDVISFVVTVELYRQQPTVSRRACSSVFSTYLAEDALFKVSIPEEAKLAVESCLESPTPYMFDACLPFAYDHLVNQWRSFLLTPLYLSFSKKALFANVFPASVFSAEQVQHSYKFLIRDFRLSFNVMAELEERAGQFNHAQGPFPHLPDCTFDVMPVILWTVRLYYPFLHLVLFCERELSSENLSFLIAVEELRVCAAAKQAQLAQSIFDDFCVPNAKNEINISDTTREAIDMANPSVATFAAAKHEICVLMQRDTYTRFCVQQQATNSDNYLQASLNFSEHEDANDMKRDAKFRKRFHFDESEYVITEVSCSMDRPKKKASIHGTLFLSPNYMSFWANIFGFKTVLATPFRDIVAATIRPCHSVIELILTDGTDVTLSDLDDINTVYALLRRCWKLALLDQDRHAVVERSQLQLQRKSSILTDSDWEHLQVGAIATSYSFGDTIIEEGSTCHNMYQVVKGHPMARKRVGKTFVNLTQLSPGDMFGEMSFLEGGVTSASVMCTEPGRVTVYALARTFVQDLLSVDPTLPARFYRFLGSNLASRLSASHSHVSAPVATKRDISDEKFRVFVRSRDPSEVILSEWPVAVEQATGKLFLSKSFGLFYSKTMFDVVATPFDCTNVTSLELNDESVTLHYDNSESSLSCLLIIRAGQAAGNIYLALQRSCNRGHQCLTLPPFPLPLEHGLSEQDWTQFVEHHSTAVEKQRGDTVIEVGTMHPNLYKVNSGQLRVQARDGTVLRELHSGDVFGEFTLLPVERTPECASVVVTSECARLAVIPHSSIAPLPATNPELGGRMFHSIAVYLSAKLRRQ